MIENGPQVWLCSQVDEATQVNVERGFMYLPGLHFDRLWGNFSRCFRPFASKFVLPDHFNHCHKVEINLENFCSWYSVSSLQRR